MSLHTIGQSPIARRWIGALAVLVLAMRAAIPTGFMLGQADGQLNVVLCPAVGAPLAPLAPHDASAESLMSGMHHHADAHAAHHLTAAASCPFALASGAVLLSQALKIPDPYFVALRPAPAPVVLSVPAAAPLRHQAPRGPPALV